MVSENTVNFASRELQIGKRGDATQVKIKSEDEKIYTTQIKKIWNRQSGAQGHCCDPAKLRGGETGLIGTRSSPYRIHVDGDRDRVADEQRFKVPLTVSM
ncbi:uncharacterized protein PV09_03150 [Verruconis gallopava]|uniref:Uncharacterized protein n=1 Tax=Verruconis gallopava TaxID=253628 RepID=A0A0D2AHD9_9PEZI|nr:uncharacterized protein PV09_03150 [Verruconis gallopava]KIW05965.1 hypothetical protein PV09_03150 [Verruconis gallopava]